MQLSCGLETADAGKASVIEFCSARNGGTPGENSSLMRATDGRTMADNKRLMGKAHMGDTSKRDKQAKTPDYSQQETMA